MLRELLPAVKKFWGPLDPMVRFLEALVDTLEPQECPQGCDAIIRELRSELALSKEMSDRLCQDAHRLAQEHEQATGEREKLLESCRFWKPRAMNAERYRDKAQAEIERLRAGCQWWKRQCEHARREVTHLSGVTSAQAPYVEELKGEIERLRKELAEANAELAKAQTEIERLRPLAENWQLVLGMRNNSRLERGNEYYSVSWIGDPVQHPPGYQGAYGAPAKFGTIPSMDPVEHLRTIERSEKEET